MPVNLNYNATVVSPQMSSLNINIPAGGVGIATVIVNVPGGTPPLVEVKATVGVEGMGSILFILFRDGAPIFTARQDLGTAFQQFDIVTMQAVDGGSGLGFHAYTLGVQNLTTNSATVVGPLDISATVFG